MARAKVHNQMALDAIAGPAETESGKPRRQAEPKTAPAAMFRASGAAIPGMPAPGKVVTVDIRDIPAWREKNKARIEHFERRGRDVIGWVEAATDER